MKYPESESIEKKTMKMFILDSYALLCLFDKKRRPEKEAVTQYLEDAEKRIYLKEFINRKFEGLDKRFEGIDRKSENIHNEIVNLELRIKASHSDLLMKFFAIVAGCISIGIAVAKLLW